MKQAIGVIIKKKDKMLLIQRGHGVKNEIGKWENVGGKVEPGEGPRDAAIREVKEEIGADIKITKEIAHFENSFSDEYEIFIYEAELISEIGKIEKTAVADYKWFGMDELSKVDLANYCRSDFKRLGYIK